MLDIQILGSPEIRWNDQPIQIARRIPRTILYYLSTFQHPVPRAEIMSIFWPDQDERSARDALRDNLAKLRKSLPDSEILHTDNLTVQLEKSLVQVDYIIFQQLINHIGRQPWQIPDGEPLPTHLVTQMANALGLWRAPRILYGAHLPDSQPLDEWLGIIEQSLYIKRDRIQERLIQHYIAARNFDASLRLIDQGISTDPANEELHILKLNTLILSGQRGEALRYGQYVQDLFHDEYHEQPSSQFMQLIQKIKAEQRQIDLTRPHVFHSLNSTASLFSGRKEQISRMNAAFQSGQVVLIEGDFGLGKTTLISEFVKQLEPPARLLPATCHPSTRVIPFQPLIEMIRTSIHPGELTRLDGYDQHYLSLLDPAFHLSPRMETKIENLPISEYHPWIHEAIYHLIRSVCKSQKGLLVLDNAESADEATLTTCRIMVKNQFLFTQASLVLARTKGIPNPALDQFLLDLTSQNRVVRINLEVLTLPEVRDLVDKLSAQPISDEELAALHQDTLGNPLLIMERMRTFSLEPGFIQTANGTRVIPTSLRALMRDQYLRFTPEMQTVAALIALSESPAQMEIIESASQLPVDSVVRAIEALEEQEVILAEGDPVSGSIAYQFRQRILHDVILLELSETRKRLLRRRLAGVIEDLRQGTIEKQAAILAQLYEASGNYEKAFKYWNINAGFAQKLSSPEDARQSFQRAQSILPYIDGLFSDDDLADYYQNRADLAYFTLDTDELLNIHHQLMNYGKNRSSALLLGDGLASLANQQFCLKQYNACLETVDLMLRYYQEAGFITRQLKGANRKAKCLYMLSRFHEANQVLELALRSLPSDLDDETRIVKANLVYDSAMMLIFLGKPAKSIPQAEDALQIFIQSHEIEGQVKSYAALTLGHVYTGEIAKAESEGMLGLQLAEQIQYIRMQGYLMVYLASAKASLGKLDEAWSLAQKARKIGEEYKYPEIIAFAERVFGDSYRLLGDIHNAVRHYQAAYDQGGDSLMKYDCLARLGYLTSITEDPVRGQEMVAEAQHAASQMSLGGIVVSTRIYQLISWKDPAFLQQYRPTLEALAMECEERGLASQWGVIQSLLTRLDFRQNQSDLAIKRISLLNEKGREQESLWISVLVNSLRDYACPENSPLHKHWNSLIHDYLDRLEKNCQSEPLRGSFLRFRKSIDKTG